MERVFRRGALHFRAVLVAALFLFGCGGGESSPVSGEILKAKPRAGLHFGYWWGCRNYLLEQADHVDTWMAVGQCAADSAAPWHLRVAQELAAARGAGVKNVIFKPDTYDIPELRFQFTRLSEGGWLNGWDSIAIVFDEPEIFGWTDDSLSQRVQQLRQLALDVPGLLPLKVGVFYGCRAGQRPGIRAMDLVGCFNYEGDGCARLEGDYAGLRAQLKFSARLWLIPGGAKIGDKSGRQDPACWASYAHRNLDVWGIVAFMWQDGDDPRIAIAGIRGDALMRRLYCETGRVILKPDEPPRC